MGRESATGLTYLVQRPDNGNYVYHRKVPDRLRSLLTGSISLDWRGGSLHLGNLSTIKISLSTRDDREMRRRHAKIHVQIEEVLEKAHARLSISNKAELAALATRLSAADMQKLGHQRRHDVLARDDQAIIDPHHRSPVAELLTRLPGKAGRPADVVQRAQDVERRKAEGDLKARDILSYKAGISEGEIEIGPEVMDRLLAQSQIVDVRKIKISKEDLAELLQPLKNPGLISSPVDDVLAENGIAIPKTHPDRDALALVLLRSEVSAHQTIVRRRKGDPCPTPERPLPVVLPSIAPKISEILDRWIDDRRPEGKTLADTKLYVDAFIGLFGDIAISAVTKKMVREYRDLLRKRPRNMPWTIRKLPLRDQVLWGETRGDCRPLSDQTTNSKGIGALSAIFAMAMAEDHINENLCLGQLLKIKDTVARLPYNTDDLNSIFSSVIYTEGKRWTAGGGDAQYWIPLLALFTGLRLEEIGQLLIGDIRTEGHITYINVTDLDEAAEKAGVKGEWKALKTRSARRQVPVHPFLIAKGFSGYVATMKNEGHRRLFPCLTLYRGKYTKNWSRWWGRFADDHVTKSQRKCFHSFRHVFADRIRNITGGMEDVVAALLGHKKPMYGASISLETRYAVICKLDYPGVDFSLVRGFPETGKNPL